MFESIPESERDDYAKRFTAQVGACLQRHAPVVPTVAQGILELKRSKGASKLDRCVCVCCATGNGAEAKESAIWTGVILFCATAVSADNS